LAARANQFDIETQARAEATHMHATFNMLIAAAGGVVPAAPVAQVKVPQPEAFSGTQEEVRHFLQMMTLYMSHPQHTTQFTDDEQKICFFITRLSGQAQRWASPIAQAFIARGNLLACCTDWDTFRQHFKATHQENNLCLETARMLGDATLDGGVSTGF
jgi:hypothetical protein